jgi:formylglycine-generating enzyme required for sulfatase activity
MKLTKNQELEKIEELKKYITECDRENDWVSIGYDKIPKEVFDRYGVKPFEIMRKKMRNDKGEVWNNITFLDAKKEAEKLGYHLPTVQQQLVLLDWYKHEKGNNVSIRDEEFLGIEELSYYEKVYLEWIDGPTSFIRGGNWNSGSNAGVETLNLINTPGSSGYYIGFRCAR